MGGRLGVAILLLTPAVLLAVGCGGADKNGQPAQSAASGSGAQGTPGGAASSAQAPAGSSPTRATGLAPESGSAVPIANRIAGCLSRAAISPLRSEDLGREVRSVQARTRDGNVVQVVVERPGASDIARNLALSQSKNHPESGVTVGAGGKAFGSFRTRPRPQDARALKNCLK